MLHFFIKLLCLMFFGQMIDFFCEILRQNASFALDKMSCLCYFHIIDVKKKLYFFSTI